MSMDSLPVEILLEIGKTDLETYRGMLAIPKFARGVTVGYRLNMMMVANYNFTRTLYSAIRCSGKFYIRREKNEISYILSAGYGGIQIYAENFAEVLFNDGKYAHTDINKLIAYNDGYRKFPRSKFDHITAQGVHYS